MATRLDQNIITILNQLVEACRKRRGGYEIARTGIGTPDVQQLFEQCAQRSEQFEEELEEIIREHGEEPADRASASGPKLQAWTHIKVVALTGDEGVILAECEHGEDATLERYEEILGAPLPAELRERLMQQFSEIRQAHNHIRSLRDSVRISPTE